MPSGGFRFALPTLRSAMTKEKGKRNADRRVQPTSASRDAAHARRGMLAYRRSTAALAAASERRSSAPDTHFLGLGRTRDPKASNNRVRKTVRSFSGRYPRLPVPVQRDCTRGPVMMPSGRVLPKPPGSTGDEPMPAGTAPAPPPGSPPDGVLVRERDWGYVTGRRTFVNDEIALSVTIRRSAACRVRAPICATRLVNRRKARRHD